MQTTETTLGNTLSTTGFAPKLPRGFRTTPLSWIGEGNTPVRSITPITQDDVLAMRRGVLAE